MHIDVDLARRQRQKHARHGVPITRQQSTVRFVQSVTQHTILYRSAIDKEKLLAPGSAMHGGFGNIAIYLHIGAVVRHLQHLLLKTCPEQHLQTLPEPCGGSPLQVQAAVQMQGHMHRWRRQGERGAPVGDMAGLGGRMFEEFAARRRVVKQLADAYRRPRRGPTGFHLQAGAAGNNNACPERLGLTAGDQLQA